MEPLQKNTIRHNLIRITTLAVGSALLISLLAVSAYNLSNYRKALMQNLMFQAKIIGINSSAAILFNNRKDAEETLSALKAVPNIVSGVIYTKDRKVFAVYQRNISKESFSRIPLQKSGHQFALDHLFLLQPIIADNETIGTIYLKSDLKAFYSYLSLHVVVIIAVILISLLISSRLLSRLQQIITGPIVDLVELMKTVSEDKDYSIRSIINKGPSELQYLSNGFNGMLEQIHRRDFELELQRQSLEKTVEMRTGELAKSNEQLEQELAERKRTEALVASTKARLQHLLISSPAIIYSCNPNEGMSVAALNESPCRPADEFNPPVEFLTGFTFVSENVRDQLGCEPGEFLEDPDFWSSRLHPDDMDQIAAGINRLLKRGHHIHEYRFKRKDGSYLWIRDEMRLLLDEKGKSLEIVGYWIDITERKNVEEQLTQRAFYDQLTGLPNRSLFIDRLRSSFNHKMRDNNYLFAVVFMDVDRFKIINDSLGHLIGDQLLIMFARRVAKCVRTLDTVARLGGDEFAILFENIKNISDVYPIISRIMSEMGLPFSLSGKEVFVSTSMGITLSNMNQYNQPDEILRDADIALYYAKASGKACHVLFDSSMHKRAVKVLQMETDLRRAIERKEFVLHYQPIVSMEDNKLTGFEALLRWQSPNGIISPDDFIPIAEESGLIVPIGHWILHEACRQMHEWQERFPHFRYFTISVNISTKEFSQPGFVQLIEKTLKETGLSARSLKLEITEKMIIENYEHAATVFQQLRALNIHIEIDDFGTGHSALNYMLHLPIDALKIDRSFVRKATTDEDVKKIVMTIIALAHTMKMDVVAEGIETEKEMLLFREMDSEYAQGFFFSKPLDNKAVETFYAAECCSGTHESDIVRYNND